MMLEPFEEKIQMQIFYMCLFLAGALFVLYLSGIDFGQWLPGCFLYEKYHLYCPGCGGTRAVRALLKGQLLKSFLYHPVVLYTAVIYILFLFSNIFYRLSLTKRAFLLRPVYFCAAVAIIIVQCFVKNLILFLG